jgi:hypothetical protein
MAVVGTGACVVVVLLPDGEVVVVPFDELLPQAASTRAPTASPAPILQAESSLRFRCIWLIFLLSSTTLLAPARSVPLSAGKPPHFVL